MSDLAPQDFVRLASDHFSTASGRVSFRCSLSRNGHLYNAPKSDLLRAHYTDLPAKLAKEGTDPRIPWLFNYKLDLRFK
jgi:hypothetical protein